MYDDESDYSEEDEDLGYSSEENVTDNSADEDPEEVCRVNHDLSADRS